MPKGWSFILLASILGFMSSCQKIKNEGMPINNNEGRVSKTSARSDSSTTQGPSHYLVYLIQNSGDTALLFQARREEARVRDSILTLRSAGINVYLPNGAYNPIFVGQANAIIDSSDLPQLFKDNMKNRLWGIVAPAFPE